MNTASRPAALFDFDGTISRIDSALPFLLYLLRHYPAGLADLPRLLGRTVPLALGRIGMTRYKTDTLRLYDRVPPELRPALMQSFHDEKLVPLYLPGALARIQWHKRAGHLLVLASASIDVYLKPVVRELGFDCLIGTRVEENGRSKVTGPNCWGKEKVNRIIAQPWFDQIDWAESWAYSDSQADLPMLMLCGNPVATRPQARLKRHAQKRGWPVVDWADEHCHLPQ